MSWSYLCFGCLSTWEIFSICLLLDPLSIRASSVAALQWPHRWKRRVIGSVGFRKFQQQKHSSVTVQKNLLSLRGTSGFCPTGKVPENGSSRCLALWLLHHHSGSQSIGARCGAVFEETHEWKSRSWGRLSSQKKKPSSRKASPWLSGPLNTVKVCFARFKGHHRWKCGLGARACCPVNFIF